MLQESLQNVCSLETDRVEEQVVAEETERTATGAGSAMRTGCPQNVKSQAKGEGVECTTNVHDCQVEVKVSNDDARIIVTVKSERSLLVVICSTTECH
jgi:hypothetical protein